MADKIEIEILPDGTLKISTDRVSMPNHAGCEALIKELITGAGGQSTRVRKGMTSHTHSQEHQHEH